MCWYGLLDLELSAARAAIGRGEGVMSDFAEHVRTVTPR